MEDNLTNCPYCSTRIRLTDRSCTQCGAPNSPDPEPWLKSMTTRFKAAFLAKTEHVWADRLASLMPIQFLLSLAGLYASLIRHPSNTVGVIVSIMTAVFILIFYPGWYKDAPEKRKNYGVVHFLITLVQIIVFLVPFR